MNFSISKFQMHQWIVFLMTFWAYVSLHTSRQAYSNAKSTMKDHWNFSVNLEGAMDAAFLFAYAIGLYLSGYFGDIFDATKLQSFGLIGTAIVISIFGSSYHYFDMEGESYKNFNFWYFVCLWFINGLIQSTGWPTAVKIMGKWFGESHAGFIFGIWSANASVGNIVGAAMVSFVNSNNLTNRYMFYLPAMQLVLCAILLLIFVRTEPSQWGIIQLNNNDHESNPNDPNVSSMWNVKELSLQKQRQKQNNDNDTNKALLSKSDTTVSTSIPISSDDYNLSEVKIKSATKPHLSFIEAFLIPNVITYALCYACLKAVNYTMFFWLPYFLNNTFSTTASDNLSIVYNVGQIFGGWVCGWISDFLRRRAPPVFAFLLIAIPPIFLLRIPSSSAAFVGTLVGFAGFFVGGPANMISSAISADLGKHKSLMGNTAALATVAGIIDGTGSFGAAACQYVVALLSKVSWDLVFVVLAVLLLASATLLLRLTINECRILYRYGRKDSTQIKKEYGVDIQ